MFHGLRHCTALVTSWVRSNYDVSAGAATVLVWSSYVPGYTAASPRLRPAMFLLPAGFFRCVLAQCNDVCLLSTYGLGPAYF